MKKGEMILRGIDFGCVWVASGLLNFFGQGWDYQKIYKMLFPKGYNFKGVTEVGKTTTLNARDGITKGQGSMPLKRNLQPVELFPACIKVFFFIATVVNAVGLTGPGAAILFKANEWQIKKKPHVISFMSIESTKEKRLAEFQKFIELFLCHLPDFLAPVALEINVSCPNTAHDPRVLAFEALEMLRMAQVLNIPVGIKFGPEVTVETLVHVDKSGFCDFITLCNTLKVGNLAEKFNWGLAFGLPSILFAFFGKFYSPLEKFGGGGYSGPMLRPIVLDLIRDARAAGVKTKIIACGGIQKAKHVIEMAEAGADGIEFGTIAIVRPWRVRSIIETAKEVFPYKLAA